MKKLLFLFACLLQFAFSADAQSKLCITNTRECPIYVALYAGAPAAPAPGPYAPFSLRIDVIIPPGASKCFTDYADVLPTSVAGWWGGAALPTPASSTIGFQWTGAQIQFQECDPIGGCGIQIGDGSPGWPPFASSGCMDGSFGPLPGGMPGDTEIIVW